MVSRFERYAITFLRTFMGGFNLFSGLNYYLRFWPQPIPHDPIGAAYMQVTLQLGLFQLAKVIEMVGGAMLLFDVYVPLGLVLLFPVTATVFIMDSFTSDLLHVRVSGARNFAFHVLLFAGYGRYFLPMLAGPKAAIRPIWRLGTSGKATTSGREGAYSGV